MVVSHRLTRRTVACGMGGCWLGVVLVALPLALLPSAAPLWGSAQDPIATYRSLRTARPDGRTIDVSGFTLTKDVFSLRFSSGRFHLLEAVDGESPGAVFVGQGSYTLTPASAVERRYVALLSGKRKARSFSDTFDAAVLLYGSDTRAQILGAGPVREAAPDPGAGKILTDRTRQDEDAPGTDYFLRLLRDRLNDEGRAGSPFFALVRGQRLRRAVLAVDSMGLLDAEGSCLLVEEGKEVGYWYSSHTQEQLQAGVSTKPMRLVDAQHYKVDSRVARSTGIDGVTSVRFEVLVPELRVLPFDLMPSLRIREVSASGEGGGAVGFLQSPERDRPWAALVFSPALTGGTVAEVQIEYEGDGVLIDDGADTYQVRGRTNWYPSFGAFQDRATYDLTFRVPKGNTVIAVGQPVSTSTEGAETVSVWRSERPIAVAGFNYGEFQRRDHLEENTGIKIEVYASVGMPDAIAEINRDLQRASEGFDFRGSLQVAERDSILYINPYTGPSSLGVSPEAVTEVAMADAINTVQLMTAYFGSLESRRLAVTQQSNWNFGQAWPSLVYLPYLLGLTSLLQLELGWDGYAGFVDQVGIHEIAHQWWGHKVGWSSYRDQWLSEGFSEFSTALVLEATKGASAYREFWEQRRMFILGRQPGAELPPYAVGPITLGFRAASERSPWAAQALMYSKGGFVLHMLRMLMRDREARSDERFFTMMKDFADTYAGRRASTEDFKAHIEKHMVPELNATRNGKIDWFFNQWVYGTQIPRYESNVRIEKAPKGKYRLIGTVSQSRVSDDFIALVPAYIDFGKGNYAQFGRAPLRGNTTVNIDVTIALPKKPKGVVLNAHHDILAFD